jgi:teichuronic acid biosynthesis glycosyltransferase TuaG
MSDDNLTFAVVIPVFNGERYIQNAIESCLAQTIPPNEIIVIDDGSTDNTATIITRINASNLLYIKNEKNAGPSFSRNTGMQVAKSGWIMFLDADDIFHERKIEVIRFFLQRNKSVKAIGHSFNLQSDPLFQLETSWQQAMIPEQITTRQILLRNRIVTPAFAVSKQNGLLFNELMMFAEDHDFILRTVEKFGLWYVSLPLSSLSRPPLTPGGISADKWKMRKGEMKMYIDYCKRNGLTVAIPLFLLFSLVKHAKRMLFK